MKWIGRIYVGEAPPKISLGNTIVTAGAVEGGLVSALAICHPFTL